MRKARVRRVCKLALSFLVIACTDGGPDPEAPRAAKAVATPVAAPEPQVAPKQPPNGPRLEVVASEINSELGDLCAFDVEPRGFPVISHDGTTLVHASAFGSRIEGDKNMQLTWFYGAKNVRVEDVYQPAEDAPEAMDCEASEARVRARVALLNAELEIRTWRPLEPLDALYSEPGFLLAEHQFGGGGGLDEVLGSLAGADRPIEVYYRNGHFIAKVPGLRVLQDLERPEWRQHENEFCTTDGNIELVEFDRATKLALVHYNYNGGGCLCDDRVHVAPIELSPELLAAIDQRSTAKFMAAHAAYRLDEEHG